MAYQLATNKFNSRPLPEYSSYLDLVSHENTSPITANDTVDAIIVPAGRPAVAIANAAQLAYETDTPLVVLCSREASGHDIAQELVTHKGPWYAIDIPGDYSHPILELTASSLIPPSNLTESDISKKRNIGLILGKGLGGRLLFLDDDIKLQPAGLRKAACMLTRYSIVGFSPHPDGYPDNSVAVHAIRTLGRLQPQGKHAQAAPIGQHLSGGSLAVNLQTLTSHFPEMIYDEDWLFLYEATANKRVAVVDETSWQAEYDPFAVAKRAAREEFGNTISKGLYDHLKLSIVAQLSDERYWEEILKARRRRLEGLYEATLAYHDESHVKNEESSAHLINRIRESLIAAIEANHSISAEQCMAYYKAWHEVDTPNWNKRYVELPVGLGIEYALKLLGLLSYTISSVSTSE